MELDMCQLRGKMTVDHKMFQRSIKSGSQVFLLQRKEKDVSDPISPVSLCILGCLKQIH